MTSNDQLAAAAAAAAAKPASLLPAHSEAVKDKKDLASWWKNFKRSDKKAQYQATPQGIFGVPLQSSIRYANVAISLFNDEGKSYIYGYVPIVVAKCGVFLKEKATDVEGIFRLAGSEKRIKELRIAFDSPDKYGKGLDWIGYTVHDAANILRRYFNQLPEPIIPLEFYQRFRDPVRNHQAQAVGAIETQSPSHGVFDHEAAIRAYQALITELPPLNRQLLLYILDLLAVFASKSDLNKMTTANLAAIFQPGILNHPQHDMAPQEYRLSQDVLIFLIENQDSFLIGMQGTEADPETVREVQSGTPVKAPSSTRTPGWSKTGIGRSGSSSSIGAESVRKWGTIRRNVSVSTKHSNRSERGPSPGIPNLATPTNGVHRSNTVPSRRGGSTAHPSRFSRGKHLDPSTPNPPHDSGGPGEVAHNVAHPAAGAGTATVETIIHRPATAERCNSIQHTPTGATTFFPAVLEAASGSSSDTATPLGTVNSAQTSTIIRDEYTPKKDTTPLLTPGNSAEKSTDRSTSNTPSTAGKKGFLDILKQSPHNEGEGRKHNKLQKRRIPGTALSSAQSSAHSLHDEYEDLERSPVSPTPVPVALLSTRQDHIREAGEQENMPMAPNASAAHTTPQRNPTDATLKPTISPSNSIHSHTDVSDADMVGDDMPPQTDEQAAKKKRHRFRWSRAQNNLDQAATANNPFGAMSTREHATSRSTIGSGGSQPRKSFQEPIPMAAVATELSSQSISLHDIVFSDSERERKGPMSWLRSKLQEMKERESERRSATPDHEHVRSKSRPDLSLSGNEAGFVRGDSLEQQRAETERAGSALPVIVPAKSAAVAAAVAAGNGICNEGMSSAGESSGENHGETAKPVGAPSTESRNEVANGDQSGAINKPAVPDGGRGKGNRISRVITGPQDVSWRHGDVELDVVRRGRV